MPTYSAGETDTFEGAEQYLLQINSGEISVADSKQGATMTGITFSKNDGLIPFITSPPHQRMVIKAVADADVDIQINEGFKLDLFGYNLLRVQQQFSGANVNQTVRQIPAEDVVIDHEVLDDHTVGASGGGLARRFTPPAGTLYETMGLELSVGATGGTGTHRIIAQITEDTVADPDTFEILRGVSDGGSSIAFRNGIWLSADDTQRPSAEDATVDQMRGLRLDNDNPLEIDYENMTDADNTLNTTWSLIARRISRE